MMESAMDPRIEAQIREWRSYLIRRQTIHGEDVEELEDHLRHEMTELGAAGLTGDESFLVAIRRLGAINELSREFARERSSRLWKQLVLTGDHAREDARVLYLRFAVMAGFAVAAAAVFKAPALFGIDPFTPANVPVPGAETEFYLRNAALLVLPFLVGYFAWNRSISRREIGVLGLPFVALAVFVNVLPFRSEADTELLVAIHLPVLLWLVAGVAYLGGGWRGDSPRMDFVRFTGEWVIYYALIALGGGVLCAVTLGVFEAIDADVETAVVAWVLPCGAVGAIVVVAWLVEAKQSVIENMAPVLTGVFTPLFAAMMLAALVGMAVSGNFIDAERDILIILDVLLVLVVGLVLYSVSAREVDASRTPMDIVQTILVGSALALDTLALLAIAARISEFGWTPNRTAGLGLNIILLANLAWFAWLQTGFVLGKRPFAALERWQTRYVPVYGVWALLVIVVFPIAFSFE